MLDAIDLSDPDLYASGDPHAVWTHLRTNAPVFFQTHAVGPGFWAITRYEDVVRLSSDPRLSSAGGRSTIAEPAPPDSQIADVLVNTDPPRHTQLRALVNKAFTPRTIASLEGYVQRAVDGLVDELSDTSSADFVAAVASRLPFDVICELLGVPPSDRVLLRQAFGHFMEAKMPFIEADRQTFDMGRYFLELADDRRSRPRDDLVTRLVEAEIDGDRMTSRDVLALCALLFVAGSETTMNSISGGLLALLEHPQQRERLETDPRLWPKAIEEVMRWVTPVLNGMVRTATSDIEVRGVQISPGEKVTLWYPSANRDEDHFDDPFAFDITRQPNDHVAFGAGPHFCLGASLARLETRVTLQTLLARLTDIELDGEVTRLRSNVMHAIEQLPVRYRVRGKA
jgi:cholest-4-en-3-one 26-monooxygenase